MVFKRPGNSRDDRSARSPKSNFKGDDKKGKPAGSRYAKSSFSADKQQGDKPRRSYRSPEQGSDDKKPFAERRKPYTGRPEGDARPKRDPGNYRGDRDPSGEKRSYSPRKSAPYGSRPAGDDRPKRSYGNRAESGDRPKKSYDRESTGDKRSYSSRKSAPYGNRSEGDRPKRNTGERSFNPRFKQEHGDKPFRRSAERSFDKPFARDEFQAEPREKVMRGRKKTTQKEESGLIRLNRYISNAGICSRRKADELIIAGVISVNGEVVSELGHKVDPAKDVIRYNGETLKREKMVYVLLNKPKDYITTTDDPQERRTVMQLVEKASKERIYPVGRLDRNTTGLLLLTNDGDLADKLSHPKNNIVKLYQAELSKSLTQGDLNKIAFGLELEDGFVKPDHIAYVAGGTKRDIGIQIHSGKNRIVRRIFEHLGYEVEKLDRSVYAGLTKKDLPRGRWRYLDEKEIVQLKHLI
jgi:23S rRNA pseudouridine2605 synthase